MQSFKVFLALLALGILSPRTVAAQPPLGAQGAEGEPNRIQQWRVPPPGLAGMPRALLLRPPGDGPFRLAVIVHASTQNALRRAQMPQPEDHAPAAIGSEGPWLAETGAGVKIAGPELDRALTPLAPTTAKKR